MKRLRVNLKKSSLEFQSFQRGSRLVMDQSCLGELLPVSEGRTLTFAELREDDPLGVERDIER